MLPLLKLGTLALKTLSKPIAARLKQQAGIHPRFRNMIVSVAQVFSVLLGFVILWKWIVYVSVMMMINVLENGFLFIIASMKIKGETVFLESV